MSSSVKLWDHQVTCVEHLVDAISSSLRYGVIGLPTGAGKTATAVATGRQAIEDGLCRHALVITPFTHAADSFRVTATYLVDDRVLEAGDDAWLNPAPTGARNAQFVEWLAKPSSRALVTTHSQVVHGEGWKALLPSDCTGLLVVCDELHHGGEDATQVREFLDAVHARGGMVAGLSATLFRSDGRPVYPANVQPLVYSYTTLAARGLFPEQIQIRLVPLGASGSRLTLQHLERACSYIIAEGQVTIINIPPGNSVLTADRLIERLHQAGAEPSRILNAVGPGVATANAVRDALASERGILKDPERGYSDRSIDYVVSCQRFREAADLASCSHVASFGVTTSLQLAVQNIGRALRNKQCITGYPHQWTNRSLYTLFVPEIWAEGDVGRRQLSRMLLQLSCLLEGSDAVMHFHRLWPDLVQGMRLPPIIRSATIAKVQALVLGTSPEEEAQAREILVVETHRLREALDRAPTVAEVIATVQGLSLPVGQQVRASLQALLLAGDLHPGIVHRVQDTVREALASHVEDSSELEHTLLEVRSTSTSSWTTLADCSAASRRSSPHTWSRR
jgi:superfamily II DNA or RNA helicase